jgi:hypothetical protein
MVMNPVLPLQFDRNVMSLLRTNGIAPEYGLVAENVMGGQGKVVEFERKGTTCDVAMARPSTWEADVSPAASQAELSEYLLSLLTWNRPMITEEQVELERALMTDDEREAALSDLYGKHSLSMNTIAKEPKKTWTRTRLNVSSK